MVSQGEPTRAAGAAPPPPAPPPPGSGIELTTLFLSAVASAVAAYLTSKIWAAGTLISAAMSPVIVALVKEGLRRPTEKVANVVPNVVPAPARWTRSGASQPGLVADVPSAPAPDVAAGPVPAPGERVDPEAPHVVLPPVVAADHGPVRVYSTRARRLRWRLALVTGLLGFAVCVVLYTVPELIAGESIGRGSGHATTMFGGHARATKHRPARTTTTGPTQTTATTPAKTTTAPAKTVTQTETVTTPAATTPAAPVAPATTTPAPAPSTTAPPADGQAAPTATTP